MGDRIKTEGQIYTPQEIVRILLNSAGYYAPGIRYKHVIDNSCGDGRILKEVVSRYINSCPGSTNASQIKKELETYIHGIELNPSEVEKCKDGLSAIAEEQGGITGVNWDIRCGDALSITDYEGKMDYVLGNPPYVRIHNMKNGAYKDFSFSKDGMADLYLAFYEHGLNMRNEHGILSYIAPSPWIYSASGKNMRKYVERTRELSKVIDFESTQVFENVQTYVMIAVFDKNRHNEIAYYQYDGKLFSEYKVADLVYDDIFIDGKIFFGTSEELDAIRKINGCKANGIVVKNGYATLADKIFIDGLPPLSKYTINVIKASTGEWKKCLFPYDGLTPVPLDVIKSEAVDVYDYIVENETQLKARTFDHTNGEHWHLIGRNQGLGDTFKHKIAVNCIIRTSGDLKINDVRPGEGVYSGLYILTDNPVSWAEKLLRTDEFVSYVKSLRKYKSGGYYTFSSKDLQQYLNFKAYVDENTKM